MKPFKIAAQVLVLTAAFAVTSGCGNDATTESAATPVGDDETATVTARNSLYGSHALDFDKTLEISVLGKVLKNSPHPREDYNDSRVVLKSDGFEVYDRGRLELNATDCTVKKGKTFVTYEQRDERNVRIRIRHKFEIHDGMILYKWISKKDGSEKIISVYKL